MEVLTRCVAEVGDMRLDFFVEFLHGVFGVEVPDDTRPSHLQTLDHFARCIVGGRKVIHVDIRE